MLATRGAATSAPSSAPRTAAATQLSRHSCSVYDAAAKAQDLIHQVYYGTLRPSAIASLAQFVQRAFNNSNQVAIGILARADRL